MADHNHDTHITRETHVERSSGGSGLAFIVGGIVVAVLVIAYFVFGWGGSSTGTVGGADGTDVTIEAPEANASSGAAADGGAAADAETAPAEDGAAANTDAAPAAEATAN